MNHGHARSNFWSLSDIELAKECRVIAESTSASVSATVKAEATRLYGDWRNAINFPEQDRQEKARRAAVTAGLRKRTIQILVNLGDIEYQPVSDESEE
jgi:hypothetical protein